MKTIRLSDADAAMLALLLKRLTYEDVRRRAENEVQLYGMLEAAERCRGEIERSRG